MKLRATTAFIPGDRFVSISITGTWCGLNCVFCGGRYLKSMVRAESPWRLHEVLHHYYRAGSRGFLISGGFNSTGYLPITEEHLHVLNKFKEGDVFLSIHLGLAPTSLIDKVMDVFDMVDFEVPPSQDYVKLGRGLDIPVEDYLEVLRYIVRNYSEDRVAAHIVLNSPYSSTNQELEILRRISGIYRRILVLLIDRAHRSVDHDRILRAVRLARELFDEVALGCMRPGGLGGLVDKLVGNGYVNRIVLPERSLIEKHNMSVFYSCCSVPTSKLSLFMR